MDGTQALILLGAGFAATVVLEALLIGVARQRGWLAVPNERSFHSVATPTLGGVAFALPILAWLVMLSPSAPGLGGIVFGAAGLALVGLVDDLRETGRGIRMAAQILALALVLWSLRLDWPWWAYAPAGLLFVWQVNLYNFMDGIDGLVAVQTLFFCLAVHLLSGGVPGWPGTMLWLTAGAMLGFLVYNWTPARVFMGDAGSVFLGLVVGIAVLLLATRNHLPLLACSVLLTAFWFDASYTLSVRVLTGQAFTEPHRSHLYQKLAARFGNLWALLGFSAFCVLWLLPLAVAVVSYAHSPVVGVACQVVAALPLAVAAWYWRAGLADRKPEGAV